MSECETEMDVSSMKVADLKRELKKRGLSADGKKQELIERLLLADTRTKGSDEILNEEEADNLLKDDEEEPPKKKVAIKRDVAIPPSAVATEETEEVQKEPTEEAKPISPSALSKMSDTEKTEARKERFTGSAEGPNCEDLKASRAARFGLDSDIEKLKKRTDRFGQVNSNAIKKLEDAEKIKKRQERFGVVAAASLGPADPANEEKLKQRAARFGGPSNENEKKKLRALRFGVAAS